MGKNGPALRLCLLITIAITIAITVTRIQLQVVQGTRYKVHGQRQVQAQVEPQQKSSYFLLGGVWGLFDGRNRLARTPPPLQINFGAEMDRFCNEKYKRDDSGRPSNSGGPRA